MFCKTKKVILALGLMLSGSQIVQAETQLDYGDILNSGGSLSGTSFSLETASPYIQTLAESDSFRLVPSFVVSICGNDLREGLEECDGTDFDSLTCADYGFNSGVLNCDKTCKILTTSCFNSAVGAGGGSGRIEYCGNFVVEEEKGEECDDGNHVSGDGCSSTCLFEEGSVLNEGVENQNENEEENQSIENGGGEVVPEENETEAVEPETNEAVQIVEEYHPASMTTGEIIWPAEELEEALHSSANLTKTTDVTPVLTGELQKKTSYTVSLRKGNELVSLGELGFETDREGNFLYELPAGLSAGEYLVQVYEKGGLDAVLEVNFEVTEEVYPKLWMKALGGHESLVSVPNEVQKLGSIYVVDNPVLRGVAAEGAKVVVYMENAGVLKRFEVVAGTDGVFEVELPTHSGYTRLTVLQVYADGTISENLTYVYENLNTCITQESSTLTFVLLIILSLLLGAYLHRVFTEQKIKKKYAKK